MTSPILSRVVSAIILSGTCLCSLSIRAQSPSAAQRLKDLPSSERSEFFKAKNRWQLTPVDVQSQADTVTPDVRAKRDAYLRPYLEDLVKETTPRPPKGVPSDRVVAMVGGVSFWGDAPEVPTIPNAIWVIAKFESFHVFAIDPQYRLIHTEMNFRVTQVIRQPSSLSLKPGDLLDSNVTGGRLKKPDGTIVSFFIRPSRYSCEPGHTYLLVGTYNPTTEYVDLYNSWDVSSGKVVPHTVPEIDRAAKGNSKLSGLTITEAAQYLDSVLPADSSQ